MPGNVYAPVLQLTEKPLINVVEDKYKPSELNKIAFQRLLIEEYQPIDEETTPDDELINEYVSLIGKPQNKFAHLQTIEDEDSIEVSYKKVNAKESDDEYLDLIPHDSEESESEEKEVVQNRDKFQIHIFHNRQKDTKIALFSVVADNEQPNQTLFPLAYALELYKEKNIFCDRLLIPVGCAADQHYKLLVIDTPLDNQALPVARFYESKSRVISAIKALVYESKDKIINTIKTLVGEKTIPGYVEDCCKKYFKDLRYSEIALGNQEILDFVNCGLYVIKYIECEASYAKIPLKIDLHTEKQLQMAALDLFHDAHQSKTKSVYNRQQPNLADMIKFYFFPPSLALNPAPKNVALNHNSMP